MVLRCICHGFIGDYEIQEPTLEDSVKAEWNNDFSSWIPRYSKPEHACDYCSSRHLECFITYEGQSACSPCSALFRPCSFSQPGARQQKSKHALDTLDVVREDTAHCFGGLTGIKPMRCLGHVGPIERDDDENDKGSRKGSARFARSAVKILKDWMDEHIDHPYPTEKDKEELKNKTGLTSSQISNWMANTRRRQKARPKRAASPSLRPSTAAINIPSDRNWESMNPFERWKHSPPENEPAPLTAIAKAVENFDPPEPPSLSSSYGARKQDSNGSSGSFSIFRAPSTTSLETGFTNFSSGSAQSLNSAWSHGSRNSLNSFNSLNSNSKKDRRRHRVPPRMPKPDLNSASQRLFQCTFCTDRFKSKYDWSRHEKSLHLSLEKWICAPLGDVIACSASGQRKCVYCDALDPTAEHLETHNHSACEEKGLEARTFYRKDHLRQHLRLMHSCKMTPSMENWKSEVTYIKSRCGFCAQEFTKWQDRADHLAKEFRNGAQMKDWKGCRGLEAHVAAQVTNAMPPYLIANESKSPFPFSASNTASMAHHTLYLTSPDLEAAIPTAASCTGGFYAQEWGDVSLQAAGYTPHSDPLLPTTTTTSGPSITPSTWTSNLTTAHSSSTTAPTSPQQTPGDSSSSGSNPPPNSSTATCWEILTLRLGRFAQQQMEQGGSVPDELLQRQARRILYGDDDPWNQTAADNPEWLALFKKAHGVEAAAPGFDRRDALEDLGVLGDVAAFEGLLEEGRWGVQRGVAVAAAEGAAAGGWGAIPEIECVGDGGEICVGEDGDVGGGGTDGGLDCFRFEQWEQLPEFAGAVGAPQVMRWDESELALGMDFST